ncbi:DUF4244 domain-containing protein [Pimelobacter simplex]|uniref:Uncharacterized protein n=1 Tax=Nocardioides simplex TaxID=2045 RepID=A0A0A1DQL8_NOCSI|nr:DUF4244 domain-containing protein [Pimelobacter simplex]AIY19649.2 hypothetical protein KR76_01625 [Pimelobacter simplex]MCG8150372.1 DUF4244 domain-containing protein [Pimelobacter simplex]GEB16739.1 hypothetical protein NSI01_50540 [Pimelobacter simplex]SFM89195.1 Protein of unknown function [Pimelobacter simplex]
MNHHPSRHLSRHPTRAHPRPRLRPRCRDERGVTTAEYAVATAAGAGFAGLLFKLLTGGFGNRLIKSLFDHVLAVLGLG